MLCRMTGLNWTSKTSTPSLTEILIPEPLLLCPGCQVSPACSPAAHPRLEIFTDLHWQTFIPFFHLPRYCFVLGVYDVKHRLDYLRKKPLLRQACWGCRGEGCGVDEKLNPVIQVMVTSHFSTIVGFLLEYEISSGFWRL
jgi:hypothetical protein